MSSLPGADDKNDCASHEANHADLGARVEELLAQKEHFDHPLRSALEALYATHTQQLYRLERLTHISDQYQVSAHAERNSLGARFEKSVKQIERIARISDRYQHMLHDLNIELRRASTHDVLTALPNRGLMLDRLREEVGRMHRSGRTSTVVMADLDHFKSINDTYGHAAGDAVLVAYSRAVGSQLRHYDLMARWGGEEFLLLLPETALTPALEIVERVRVVVSNLSIESDANRITFTSSFGVAAFDASVDIGLTLRRADDALYQAKQAGRNCVVASAST